MTRSALFVLAAAAAGCVVLACSASGDPGPVSASSGSGGASDASAANGGTAGQSSAGSAGQAGAAGEEQGGSAGQGGSAEGGSAGQGGSAGAEDAGPPCDKYWTREICPEVGSTPGASVGFDFQGGFLELTETSAPFLCGSATKPAVPLKLYQSGLTGDFEVVFTFEQFTAAAYGVALHAYVYEISNDQEWAEASLLDNGSGLNTRVTVTHNGVKQEDMGSTSHTGGTLTIRRVGAFVTALVDVGGDKKNITGTLSKNDMRVGIGLQGPFNPADPPAASSVRISAFSVTSAASKVHADAFDCNSVY